MSTIAKENAKRIRRPFQVRCGLYARSHGADLTFEITDDSKVVLADSALNTSLEETAWDMRNLTDLAGDGFLLNGSCEWYNGSSAASESGGKLGIRSHVNTGLILKVNSSVALEAITLTFRAGTGYINTSEGDTYDIYRTVVVNMHNKKTIKLTIHSVDNTERIEIDSIVPGIDLDLTNNEITNVTVSLRANLDIENPSWEISDIEISAYWANDISALVSYIYDNTPITYRAGYPGDYSPVRRFYVSEAVTQQDNIITIRGEDASHKLDDEELDDAIVLMKRNEIDRRVYYLLENAIDVSGIKLRHREKAPDLSGSVTTIDPLVFKGSSARDRVAYLMNVACDRDTFYPRFVDAGIPTLAWSKPTSKWVIKEAECGEVRRVVNRNVAKIKSTDEYGLTSTAELKSTTDEDEVSVKAGRIYSNSMDGFFYDIKVTNATEVIKQTATEITWRAKLTSGDDKTNLSKITGREVRVTRVDRKIVDGAKPGITVEVQPQVYGAAYSQNTAKDSKTRRFPNYRKLFSRSNVRGSFTWKGDPRMQPRDVFTFVHLDGSKELCTIESIVLKHENGGTTAEIVYRKGVC